MSFGNQVDSDDSTRDLHDSKCHKSTTDEDKPVEGEFDDLKGKAKLDDSFDEITPVVTKEKISHSKLFII